MLLERRSDMTSMGVDQARIREGSHHRCCADSQFLHHCYENLLASDLQIPPIFAETEFDQLTRLHRHALEPGVELMLEKR